MTFMLTFGLVTIVLLSLQVMRSHAIAHAAPPSVPAKPVRPPHLWFANWGSYTYDLAGSNDNTLETTLTAANFSQLAVRWTAHGSLGTSARPIVTGNVVYWGDWGGNLHATFITGNNAGKDALKPVALGVTTAPGCSPSPIGIASTPTLGTLNAKTVLYVGGGGNDATGGDGVYVYAIYASGGMAWKTKIGIPSSGDFAWSSPILYNGHIYYGVASLGDCPLTQGRIVMLNAMTGAIEHTFYTVPAGCLGGGVWGSPSIDTATGKLYIATGTPSPDCFGQPGDYSMSLLELNLADLSPVASWRVPANEQSNDGDFGSVPTLFHGVVQGKSLNLVGVANKNGIFYAFNRANIEAGPVWQDRVSIGGFDSLDPAAWDGTTLYVGEGTTTINGTTCKGSVRAINPNDGSFKWQACLADGGLLGSISMVSGVVVVTTGHGATIVALSAGTGKQIFRYKNASSMPYYAPATIVGGYVFADDMHGDLVALSLLH